MSNLQKTYIYKTVKNSQIYADVYLASSSLGLTPTIIWIHGGGLIYGSRKRINPEQLLRYTGIGCTLVSIDYRLAPETKVSSIIEDIKDAYKWIIEIGPKLFHTDPEKIAIIGHSAGGFLTLVAGLSVFPRPIALVSFYGYGDISGDWCSKPDIFYCNQPLVSQEEAYNIVGNSIITEGKSDRNLFYIYCRQQGIWSKEISGYDPNVDSSAFLSLSPIYNVSSDFPITLFVHGNKDTDVPYQQSLEMSKSLDSVGVENELIIVPDVGHVFDDDMQNPIVINTFETVLVFLKKHLKM